MRLHPRRFVLPLVAAAALLTVAACGRAGADASAKTLKIAVIPKGTTHEFWKSIHAGAIKAARELEAKGVHVDIIWKGPLREDDREQQIDVVEGFAGQGVNGIALAPLDNRALVRPVEEAQRAGVPVLIFDSALDTDSIVSFVATDNERGGELAAGRMGELLGGKGNLLVLRYAEGSASTMAREEGFLKVIRAKYPGIRIVSSDQYGGATRETAKRTAENLLNRFANDLQGIYTVNETNTVGMLLALQDIGKAGKIHLVGFDANDEIVEAMRKGQIDGFAVQNPMRMGYLAVTTMVDHLQGRAVPRRIDTGVTMVTPANLDSAGVRELVKPPFEQYLAGR